MSPWPSLAALLVLSLVHAFAGRLRFLEGIPRSRWLSLAGGVSVAYVFVHLLPELAEGQTVLREAASGALAAVQHHAYLLALVGLVAFYGVERAVKCRAERHHETRASVFWPHMLAFAVYNFTIGYLLLRGEATLVRLPWYTVAMALHFLVSDFALREQHAARYERSGRWVLVAAIVSGWGVALALALPEVVLVVMTALLSGGVVLNVLKEELPEERRSRFWAFLVGAGGYAALLLRASAG